MLGVVLTSFRQEEAMYTRNPVRSDNQSRALQDAPHTFWSLSSLILRASCGAAHIASGGGQCKLPLLLLEPLIAHELYAHWQGQPHCHSMIFLGWVCLFQTQCLLML